MLATDVHVLHQDRSGSTISPRVAGRRRYAARVGSRENANVTSDRRPFPRKMRETLCSRLLDLPGMASPGRRDYLLGQLGLDYPGLRSVQLFDEPHVDLMEILNAAYDYDGALHALLEIVTFLYPHDPGIRPIKELIDLIEPEDLLTPDERHAILQLLTEVDQSVVAAAFHYSTRTTVQEARLDARDVVAVTRYLERFTGRHNRPPPLFEFVDFVGHHPPPSTWAPLHLWMDSVGQRLGIVDRSVADELCQVTEARMAGNGRFYLVAELRTDKINTDRYFLAAWRQYEDEPEVALYESDRSVPWAEAITTVHALMRQLSMRTESTAEQRVLELIVPRALVTQSIDQRPVDTVLPAAIGTNYPLVLRSFDRLEDPSTHGDWGRNWRWLKQHDQVAGVSAIREVGSHDIGSVQALRAALLRDGPPAIVVMLSALPVSDVLTVDAFTAGLRGGASIMVWSRDDRAAEDLAESIRQASAHGLLSLREHVFHLRLRALEDARPESLGTQVVIVFDDYDRIPERFRGRARLRSPEQRRSWYP